MDSTGAPSRGREAPAAHFSIFIRRPRDRRLELRLEESMGGELDVLVSPRGGAILTRDEAASMDASEVSIDERVPCLGLVGRTFGESEQPLGIFVPAIPSLWPERGPRKPRIP